MEQGKSHVLINVLIAILIIGSIILVYFYIQTGPGEEATQEPPTALALSLQQIVSLINRLESIRLDRGVVLREDFSSLSEITQPIPTQPAGIANPFRSDGL